MKLITQENVIALRTREHMLRNNFFIRWIELRLEPGEAVGGLSFRLYAGDRVCYERRYCRDQVLKRLEAGAQELARYRQSSLHRILGREDKPALALMDEYFDVYTFDPVDRCDIVLEGAGEPVLCPVRVAPYESGNTYHFPLRGTYLVSDTYPSVNSHRWCRNSEFAMDIGRFSRDLNDPVVGGDTVYAACGGVVEEVFDGLPDSDEDTDFEALEAQWGEHARIDGNHVLLRHPGGEYTLYSHLAKGSVCVALGQRVAALEPIGAVGSSGSSTMPHLHFHAMREGVEGPGIPVTFCDLVSFFGEPCALEEATNLVRTVGPSNGMGA